VWQPDTGTIHGGADVYSEPSGGEHGYRHARADRYSTACGHDATHGDDCTAHTHRCAAYANASTTYAHASAAYADTCCEPP
jgi:hypothetical protein